MKHQISRAVWDGNDRYLRKLAAGVRLLKQIKRQPRKYEFKTVEYVFEAYFFLRKKESKGSPLPTKKDVKTTAALIQAFAATDLMDKLPKYLWDPVNTQPMPGPKVRSGREPKFHRKTSGPD